MHEVESARRATAQTGAAGAAGVEGVVGAASHPPARAWPAQLHLRIDRRGAESILAERRHRGPLRVQKALYPEGRDLAHLILVHPPAGIAAGDDLSIDVKLGQAAEALVTTPGATKWYRAHGGGARQRTKLCVARGAALEWLPQENILFDGADVTQLLEIDCEPGSRMIGWDMTVLGRRAAGEGFTRGHLQQEVRLKVADELVWFERNRAAAGDRIFASEVGWGGHAVAALMWAFGTRLDDGVMDGVRALATPGVRAGATRLSDDLLVVRALGDAREPLAHALLAWWTYLRPLVVGRAGCAPRIWST